MHPKEYLSRKEAADELTALGLKTSPATLAKWFCVRSDGPPVVHFGRFPKYPRTELLEWVRNNLTSLRTSSSEVA